MKLTTILKEIQVIGNITPEKVYELYMEIHDSMGTKRYDSKLFKDWMIHDIGYSMLGFFKKHS